MTFALRGSGIGFDRNAKIGRFTIDFLLKDAKVAIETDGSYWHNLPRNAARDREKEGILQRLGIKLIRFNEEQVEKQIDSCVEQILASAGPGILGHPELPLIDSSNKRCTVSECHRSHASNGLCNLHYTRLRTYGRLHLVRNPPNAYARCSVVGCDRPHKGRSLCAMHIQRLRKYGSTDKPQRKSIICEDDVRVIRLLHKGRVATQDIATKFGITDGHVSNIVARRVWTHIK